MRLRGLYTLLSSTTTTLSFLSLFPIQRTSVFAFAFFGSEAINNRHSPKGWHSSSRYTSTTSTTARRTSMESEVINFSYPSLEEFLRSSSSSSPSYFSNGNPPRISIGNPAGDADSLISAIGSAYLDSVLLDKPTLPVLSIAKDDLLSLRPETKYLLTSLAGVTDIDSSLVSILDDDNDILPNNNSTVHITLVDHNQLKVADRLLGHEWKVESILDHHVDEQMHTDTCCDDDREIAFDTETSQALVASTCTLLVERWQRFGKEFIPMPAALSILLLGVILVDSINLSQTAGKATARDKKAVDYLQKNTNWSELSLPGEVADDGVPNPGKLFNTLQNQKFQPSFWNGLSASQALALDYKSFTVEKEGNECTKIFGVSSVLQSLEEFIKKPSIWKSINEEYCTSCSFFVVMFLEITNDVPRRRLLLTAHDKGIFESILQYLKDKDEDTLQIDVEEQWQDPVTGLYIARIHQGNSKASRKQVAPILMEFSFKTSKL